MPYAIMIIGTAAGEPIGITGQYLLDFDFDAWDGGGFGNFTIDISHAKTFETPGEALEFWRTQSTAHPLREDGKPNRPLTSTSVEIVEVPAGASRGSGRVQ